jgi:hypothetical protein
MQARIQIRQRQGRRREGKSASAPDPYHETLPEVCGARRISARALGLAAFCPLIAGLNLSSAVRSSSE